MEIDAKAYRRFWRCVVILDEPEGCWTWTGLMTDGYGRFRIGSDNHRAHRVAHEILLGPIPPGRDAHHLCHHRSCVNPTHLQLVTPVQHAQIHNANAAKTRCVRGHDLTNPENVRVTPRQRFCRVCVRLHSARYRAKQREVAV